MIQKQFAETAAEILKHDDNVIGLAVAGSWLTGETDEFSDLDLILVTKEKISHNISAMLTYAQRLGNLLNGFTGEHVGEPRLLICLYKDPLLHVDIKFVTPEEFKVRIETPEILLDKENLLKNIIEETTARFPHPEFQWIEDRFWIWVHYALLKIGRGELTEAFDFFSALRMLALAPLLHLKNGNLPRGVRRVETQLPANDLQQLLSTIPSYSKESLLTALENAVQLYRSLRTQLFTRETVYRKETEKEVMSYFTDIRIQTFNS